MLAYARELQDAIGNQDEAAEHFIESQTIQKYEQRDQGKGIASRYRF